MSDEDRENTLGAVIAGMVYQGIYQRAIKNAIGKTLDGTLERVFSTASRYMRTSYGNGFVGSMYDLAGQGAPLHVSIDGELIDNAIEKSTKLVEGLYGRLSEIVESLKKKMAGHVSRGVSVGEPYSTIKNKMKLSKRTSANEAMRVARTEGHRVMCQSSYDACLRAREKGIDVVKEWNSVLDAKTRESHAIMNGEIRELDEKFSNGLMFPGDSSGGAGEVINCRCALSQILRSSLSEEEAYKLQAQSDALGLTEAKSFEEYKDKYLNAPEELSDTKEQGVLTNIKLSGNIESTVSGQSKLNKIQTKKIIEEAVKLDRPIFADDTFGKYVANVKKIDGYYDIAAHGSPKIVEYFKIPIDDKTIADIISKRSDYKGEAIRLLSCSVGREVEGQTCFAQRLANRLNKEVMAPTDLLWVCQNGETTIGPRPNLNIGEWKKFMPKGKKTK